MFEIKKAKHKGFTLIEVLVALFIITVGLLGVAGLQTQAMRSGNLSSQRLAAVMKVQELAERIRLNSAAVNSYNVGTVNASSGGANSNCYNGTSCSIAELAAYDIYLWRSDFNNVFPSGATGSVVVTNPTPSAAVTAAFAMVQISLNWSNNVGAQSYSTFLHVDSANTVISNDN